MRAFISYSYHDVGALERLHVDLTNLQREGRIETWYDCDILAGDVLDKEIRQELELADLFLLLVSTNFIASNYSLEREMQRTLERRDNGEARVVPIIVKPCDYAAMDELRRLKAAPKDGKPISEWANENNAYLNVVLEVARSSMRRTQRRQYLPIANSHRIPSGMACLAIFLYKAMPFSSKSLLIWAAINTLRSHFR